MSIGKSRLRDAGGMQWETENFPALQALSLMQRLGPIVNTVRLSASLSKLLDEKPAIAVQSFASMLNAKDEHGNEKIHVGAIQELFERTTVTGGYIGTRKVNTRLNVAEHFDDIFGDKLELMVRMVLWVSQCNFGAPSVDEISESPASQESETVEGDSKEQPPPTSPSKRTSRVPTVTTSVGQPSKR